MKRCFIGLLAFVPGEDRIRAESHTLRRFALTGGGAAARVRRMYLPIRRSRRSVRAILILSVIAFSGCGWEFGWDDYGGLPDETGETGETGDYERTYFIAECTDYSECPNMPLNSVGFDLRSALDNSGWTGQFKLNGGVKLTQFIDDFSFLVSERMRPERMQPHLRFSRTCECRLDSDLQARPGDDGVCDGTRQHDVVGVW